jgi:hypothetical protein
VSALAILEAKGGGGARSASSSRRRKPCGARAAVRGGAWQAGPIERPRSSGERESRLIGEEGRWSRLGRKPKLGQSSRNKMISNFIWNLDFWQTLEICTRRFRRNFVVGIFPEIY